MLQDSILYKPINHPTPQLCWCISVRLCCSVILAFVDDKGMTHCSFVMGKTRNAPIREWIIPHLELQTSVLATRLSKMIVKELDLQVDQTYFWSDSMASWQYIKNEKKRFEISVANRVAEIYETGQFPKQWHHNPGVINPADNGSRGAFAQYFHAECRWWSGRKFSWEREHTYIPVEDDNEITKSPTAMFISSASQIDVLFQHYTPWSRLIKVMSWVLRFVKGSKNKVPAYLKSSTLQQVEI